jgi:non-ribosomal peptide synthetase component E (peptide arylation enzyme)
MPDAVLGERACAYVIPRPGAAPTLAELTRFLSEDKHIARFKLPERLELRERLPMTAVGKISKKDLREEIAAALSEERS